MDKYEAHIKILFKKKTTHSDGLCTNIYCIHVYICIKMPSEYIAIDTVNELL